MSDADIVEVLAGGRRVVTLDHARQRVTGEVGVVWRGEAAVAICAHRCELAALPELAALAALERLDVGENRLAAIPALPASLRELYVHDNQLAVLPALPHLTVLDANRNQLTGVPAARIDFVYLAGNQLTAVPPVGALYLNLGENPLADLVIADRLLEELRVEQAGLTDAAIDAPALRELSLRGNRLRGLALATPQLEALDLRGNRLDDLPATLAELPLRKLDLRWNPLRRVPAWLPALAARGCLVYT